MSKVTDWKIVWVDRVTGKQRATVRRTEGMARVVCSERMASGHTDVRYRGASHKRWRVVRDTF